MKNRLLSILMLLLSCLIITGCSGGEENTTAETKPEETVSFDILKNYNFGIGRGASGYYLSMHMEEDGSFNGSYLDLTTEGENEEFYDFEGKLKDLRQIGEYEYEATVDGDFVEDPEKGPLGLSNYKDGDAVKFLMPGYPIEMLDEETRDWLYDYYMGELPDELESICIYNEAENLLLIGYEDLDIAIDTEGILGQWGQPKGEVGHIIYIKDDGTLTYYHLNKDDFDGELIKYAEGSWEYDGVTLSITNEEGTEQYSVEEDEYGNGTGLYDSDGNIYYVRSEKGRIPEE